MNGKEVKNYYLEIKMNPLLAHTPHRIPLCGIFSLSFGLDDQNLVMLVPVIYAMIISSENLQFEKQKGDVYIRDHKAFLTTIFCQTPV